jgi:hypothetical protein
MDLRGFLQRKKQQILNFKEKYSISEISLSELQSVNKNINYNYLNDIAQDVGFIVIQSDFKQFKPAENYLKICP